MKKICVFLLLLLVSCYKNEQRAVFFNSGEVVNVDTIVFYHTDKGHIYFYIKDKNMRDKIYNSKIDSVNFLIKDSVFRGKPQKLMLDGYFTTDFIMPFDSSGAKIRIYTINSKPMFPVSFVKTKHMDYIKSGFLKSTLLD